jgi:cytochrome b6-f complex subunit 5
MVEPLLSGIVLGLIPITLLGLFFDAYMQYRRENHLLANLKQTRTEAEAQAREKATIR